jgi:hypothetical protein
MTSWSNGPVLTRTGWLISLYLVMRSWSFLRAELKQGVEAGHCSPVFALASITAEHAVWTAIDLGTRWYCERARRAGREKELADCVADP